MKVSPAKRLLVLLVLSATVMKAQDNEPPKLERTIVLPNVEGPRRR